MAEYRIPSHCETAIIFEQAIMLALQPITVPFYYRVYITDSDDFFIKHCVDCPHRANACPKAGAMNTRCILGYRVETTEDVRCLQMPLPQHMMIFAEYTGNTPVFAYDRDGILLPLRIGNIGSGGDWCSGDVSFNKLDPSNIYNAYMQSLHNKDLTGKDDNEYEPYLQTVSKDFSKIFSGYEVDVTQYGSIQNVIHTPTTITWRSAETKDENYYIIKGKGYVKIQ